MRSQDAANVFPKEFGKTQRPPGTCRVHNPGYSDLETGAHARHRRRSRLKGQRWNPLHARTILQLQNSRCLPVARSVPAPSTYRVL